MVEKVQVTATYEKANHVPRIGQKKRMRVNGRIQTMTLNQIEVERIHSYSDLDNITDIYEFESKESWGAYRGCGGHW